MWFYDQCYLAQLSPLRTVSIWVGQVGKGFNRDYWERLERWCRGLTEHYAAVVVFTGPLYLANRAQDTKWYRHICHCLVSILESSTTGFLLKNRFVHLEFDITICR